MGIHISFFSALIKCCNNHPYTYALMFLYLYKRFPKTELLDQRTLSKTMMMEENSQTRSTRPQSP